MVVNFSMVPMDKGISLSPYVAHVLEVVEASGLNYHLHAMGTLIEGEWDRVFAVIKVCHEKLRSEAARVITNIQVDDRQGVTNALVTKKESVEKCLGHSLH